MNGNRILWRLKLGMILLIIGLAITIFMMGFMDHFSVELGENDADYFLYSNVQITGIIILIIGIIVVIIGFLDRYKTLIRPPVGPPPPGPQVMPPDHIQMHIKVCGRCKGQIPFDSNLCPYCGVKITEIPLK